MRVYVVFQAGNTLWQMSAGGAWYPSGIFPVVSGQTCCAPPRTHSESTRDNCFVFLTRNNEKKTRQLGRKQNLFLYSGTENETRVLLAKEWQNKLKKFGLKNLIFSLTFYSTFYTLYSKNEMRWLIGSPTVCNDFGITSSRILTCFKYLSYCSVADEIVIFIWNLKRQCHEIFFQQLQYTRQGLFI